RAASDLNQAQTFISGDATQRYLNDLVARAYATIYGRGKTDLRALVRLLVLDYPKVFRRCLPQFLLAALLFVIGATFGYLASYYDADAARAYLLPTDMPTIQPGLQGQDEETPAQTTGELAAFSSFLFANNVRVSLIAFALGMTFGVGTAWLMFYNGILLGALGAIFVQHNQLAAYATG